MKTLLATYKSSMPDDVCPKYFWSHKYVYLNFPMLETTVKGYYKITLSCVLYKISQYSRPPPFPFPTYFIPTVLKNSFLPANHNPF